MKVLLNVLKSPLAWLSFTVVVASLYQSVFSTDLQTVVRSDGRGYYAYLPALLIHQDGSFNQVIETEKAYDKGAQIYLYKDVYGETYNKYFPGVAVLQTPFFLTAIIVSWVSGFPIDGYNDFFMLLFLVGAVFYFVLGLIFFSKALKLLFPDFNQTPLGSFSLMVFASPLFYYAVYCPSLTHLYSFTLLSGFVLLLLKLKSAPTIRNYGLLGGLLGLIFLVRPTNVLIVFLIPFLLGDYDSLKTFIRHLFKEYGKRFFISLVVFLAVLSLLLVSWKWQTGSWIVWSYNGEGFNFFHPKILDALFSYRIGLFSHTPILILSAVGLVLIWGKEKYKVGSFLLYALVTTWIISAWWCWDYESVFGNRPFTEHLAILFIPTLYLMRTYRKITWSLLFFFTFFGVFRMYQTVSEITPVARYSSVSYWGSLFSYGQKEVGRWNFTASCKPFGKEVEHVRVFAKDSMVFTPRDLFGLSQTSPMPKPRANERYYYTVKLKKRHDLDSFDDVYLVVDAGCSDSEKRYYKAVKLFNDRNEGRGEWSDELTFSGIIHDNDQLFDHVKIYIWNKRKSEFQLKDVTYELSVYKA
ncbi:MAG: hypothetical protein P8N52_07570 [Crocinitomicaceae bacterium]|nr:hypothetical protein [Crocinitomicaceae bacterium]MDG1777469.1 hypothetical protein [Crocinitomicaceae bacterium]